jgi:cellulose synthase/poly-beta-1,6-N-acetylglucosamine synthase-like glycosyltransferase
VIHGALVATLITVQVMYLGALLTTIWLRLLPVDRVSRDPADYPADADLPRIVMFYPVLRELEETMRTTLIGMARAHYPEPLLRVICIPNWDDNATIEAAQRLATQFPFLEIMPIPPTTDRSWNAVWTAWENNPKAYWWHDGRRAGDMDLPAKKTRQLVWALYHVGPTCPDALLTYIDADSVIPPDYWMTAATGMRTFDVLQFTNITGNLLATWPASFYATDHIAWDATFYPHMSAHGAHPFYVLGKGLFFRISDLLALGGFHPWLTIEDPEVGMRLWVNGARLGIVESPLVEEVPATWRQGVIQRKRWVAGFFQTLSQPLAQMGMPLGKRIRARLNFVPCLSLVINPIGFVIGVWALIETFTSSRRVLSPGARVLAILSFVLTMLLIGYGISRAWQLTAIVLDNRRQRLRFVLRVNPLFLMLYWAWWGIALVVGFWMYLSDGGLTWQRTEKVDANHVLVRFGHQRKRFGRLQHPMADVGTADEAVR